MFGVDLFFVISGFVMVTVTRGKFKQPRNALAFIYHRASRNYPTYWFYTILVLIVFFIQPSWVNSSQGNQANIFASFLLLPSQTLPLVMVGWTLIHEMYFYITFFFILLLLTERNMPIALLLRGIGVLLLNFGFESRGSVYRIVSHPLTIEFIAGCLIALIYFRKNNGTTVSLLLAIACLALTASLFGYDYYQEFSGQLEPLNWM